MAAARRPDRAGPRGGHRGSAELMLSPLLSAALLASGTQTAFTVQDPRISESSGLAASTGHPGIVYTHNDSGHAAQIFALDAKGRTKATYTLDGVTARDWEGIALGKDEQGRPAIFIADIGDNQNS